MLTTKAIREPFSERPQGSQAVEIEPGILWLQLPLPMALDHVNAYALREADGWTVIDTGFNNQRTRSLWHEILHGELGGKPVRRVIMTHHHPDHVGLVGWFKSQHKAAVLATRVAWLTARMLTLDNQERPVEEALRFYKMAGMGPELYDRRKDERPFNFSDCVYPIPPGFQRLSDGQFFRMGGHDWTIRIGHGHAPDQATFWRSDGKLVIGGDQFLAGITPNIGVHPTEPEANPLEDWLQSCRMFLKFADDDMLVLPGHRAPFVGLGSRLVELIEHHEKALDQLEDSLDTPKLATDVFEVLFGRVIPEREYGLALAEAVAHVNFLYQSGRIDRINGPAESSLWVASGTRM